MMKIKKGYIMHNIVGEWIVIPSGVDAGAASRVLTLNDTGHMLWEMLEKGAAEEELLRKMLSEYDVDEKTAKEDIRSFLQMLKDKDIMI